MALIDVSFLMRDPDFADSATLIIRTMTVNQHGEGEITETSEPITASIQKPTAEQLTFVPESARLDDFITVYYNGELFAQRPGGYADMILWRGRRYQVMHIVENYINFGGGHTVALCGMEEVHA